jgi:hypothetical protein
LALKIGENTLTKALPLERTPQRPPIILPLAPDVERMTWSVMIPVYNASTDGDVAGLVASMGKGRVDYFRHASNVGSLRNFEQCIKLSRGTYVHILHGDDFVLPGFYAEIGALFNDFPHAGAAFTSFEYIDEKGQLVWQAPELDEKRGVLTNWLPRIASKNMIQPPTKVVKREVYEKLGSFYAVHYGEDWEMWVRIAAHYAVAHTPKVMALYRIHNNNISSRSMRKAQNIKDINKVIDLVGHYLPEGQKHNIQQTARKNFAEYYVRMAHKIYHDQKDTRTAVAQAMGSMRMYQSALTFKKGILLLLKAALGYRYIKSIVQRK